MSTLKTNNIQHVDRSDPSIIINTDGSVNIAGTMTYEDVTNVDAVGIITARSDVSIADKIIHTGDTNTAIRFPAADTFAVETAGSERVRVTSNGNLLVATQGTTNISGNADDIIIGTHDDTGVERGITFAGTVAGGIRWNDGSDQGVIEYSHSDNSMRFSTSSTEKLRIASDGKVGMGGATNPEEVLDLGNALQINLKVGGRGYLGQAYSTAATILGHSVKAKTTGTVSGGMEVTETNSGGGAPSAMRMQSGNIEFHTAASGTSGATFDSERLRITSDGNLQIDNDSGQIQLGDDQDLSIYHNGSNGFLKNSTGQLLLRSGTHTFENAAGSTEYARIDSSGNLILGATSYQNGGFGGTSHGINVAGTQPQVLLHETDTDKDGYFGLASGILRIQTADAIPVTIWTSDTRRVHVHETSGNMTLETGNLVIGTSGKGIDFSTNTDQGETSTATLLDDYEEGTWTPHFEIESRAASDSPVDGVQGRYVKIGNTVTCHYQLSLNGTPSERSTSRAWEIHGWPYTSVDGNSGGQMGGNQRVTGYETATYGPDGYFVFRLFNNTTYGRLEFIDNTYNGTRNASPMMLDNAQVMGTITYQTT